MTSRGWTALKRVLDGVEPQGRGRRLLLALDFDGTLAPFHRRPRHARLPVENRRLLTKLLKKEGLRMAIASGRSLADIRQRIGLPGLYYAGNHGLEIEGPRFRWIHPGARRAAGSIRRIARALKPAIEETRGAEIEDKGLSLSIHYRNAPKEAARGLRLLIESFLRGHGPHLRLEPAKRVWEIKPVLPWNKGMALRALNRRLGERRTIVFVGDDLTDEQGFASLGPRDISVRVGHAGIPTRARFRLAGLRQVTGMLDHLERSLP